MDGQREGGWEEAHSCHSSALREQVHLWEHTSSAPPNAHREEDRLWQD